MTSELFVLLAALASLSLTLLWHAWVEAPKKERRETAEMLRAFAAAVELRFPSHEGLFARTRQVAKSLGHALHLSPERMHDLERAASLRGIGLVAVPYGLVNGNPVMRWSDSDRHQYLGHAQIGAAMVEQIPSLAHLQRIVRCQHAPFDGSAGPQFPVGKDIPLEARILKISIDFAWIERNQGELLAAEHIRAGSGTEYDPRLVRILVGESGETVERTAEAVPA